MKVNVMGKVREVLFGVDAEFFLVKDGVIIPASKVIPGTKSNPFKLENGVCHPDGLSLEVGCPPAKTPEGMVQNLLKVISEVREKYLDPQGVGFYAEPWIDITKPEIASQCTRDDLEHGCSYEFFAWSSSSSVQKKRKYSDVNNKRFSGFHIHLGFTEGQSEGQLQIDDMACLARAMDCAMSRARLRTSVDRSKQYGGYGAFRVKPYGIEYRCLDSLAFLQRDKLRAMLGVLNDAPRIFDKAKRMANISGVGDHYDSEQLIQAVRRNG